MVGSLAGREFNYREPGATAGTLPPGYWHFRRSIQLASGSQTFDAAAKRLLSWEMHRGAGLHVEATNACAVQGANVLLQCGIGRVGLFAPCRVIYVLEESGRRGFAYGTLEGHPECGEEAFIVSIGPGGEVRFEIVGFSRPAGP